MKEPDYFTVMERSIVYYARKYDPENRLQKVKKSERNEEEPETDDVEKPAKIRRKKRILASFFSF